MRLVVQRVSRACVEVDGEIVGEIGQGLAVLVGIAKGDSTKDADYLAAKLVGLRLFSDSQGRMNLSTGEVGGQLLLISQFTLYGDVRKGRRPAFDRAASPDAAKELWEYFVSAVRATGTPVATGRYRAHMVPSLVLDGPVTILVDSDRSI